MHSYDRKIKEQERRRKSQEKQLESDYRKVFSSPEGERVLWDILDKCMLFSDQLYTKNSTTFFNLGKHNIGMYLAEKTIRANFDGLVKGIRIRHNQIDELEKTDSTK